MKIIFDHIQGFGKVSCYVNYLLYKDLKKKDRIIESQKRKLEEPRVR
jgi:hypothetical protein